MPHIFLDPDGTQDLGLLVIVEARTGVTYQQQCAGTYCDQRIMEGFVIPIGGAAETQKIYDWFWSNFHGNSYLRELWTEEITKQLSALVGEIRCWHGKALECHDVEPQHLRLDRTRMDECVEAWIPVVTPYGRGILTLKNSD